MRLLRQPVWRHGLLMPFECSHYMLEVRQQPRQSRMVGSGEKSDRFVCRVSVYIVLNP